MRKRVYEVYEKNEAAFESMDEKKQGDFADVRKAFSLLNELRLAQAQAQADLGMSEDEYAFLVEQVYKTAWAAEVAQRRRQDRLRRRGGRVRPRPRKPSSRRGRPHRQGARRQRPVRGTPTRA